MEMHETEGNGSVHAAVNLRAGVYIMLFVVSAAFAFC